MVTLAFGDKTYFFAYLARCLALLLGFLLDTAIRKGRSGSGTAKNQEAGVRMLVWYSHITFQCSA